jgi:hypothetical protein
MQIETVDCSCIQLTSAVLSLKPSIAAELSAAEFRWKKPNAVELKRVEFSFSAVLS